LAAHALSERAGDEESYRRINVDGTRRVLTAAAAAGVPRIVFASSVKAMGNGRGRSEPETPYATSKLEAERLVLDGGLVVEPVVLRLSLVYGPGVEGNLGGMLRAVERRRFPPPPRIDNRRSMVHVDDVVRVAIAASESPGAVGRVLVVGDGVEYSTHAIYAAMLRALGRDVPAWTLPASLWLVLAALGDGWGALTRRRAPFDRDSHEKLFGSAWYPASDLAGTLGVTAGNSGWWGGISARITTQLLSRSLLELGTLPSTDST
jgi:nucleoside-diphosphate-sugar epimerase